MSLEKDFHNFIEAQNPEAKQRGIDKVMAARAAQEPTPIPKRPFSWKKLLAIATPSVATLSVGLILLFNFLPTPPVDDGPRYCASSDYDVEQIFGRTLEEYALENDLPILYFDSLNVADRLELYEYRLNEEVIGFKEYLADTQGYPAYLHVTDKNFTLEGLSVYENLTNTAVVDNCSVYYQDKTRVSYATFTYGDYRYYLEVELPPTDTYVLDLVEILIPDNA